MPRCEINFLFARAVLPLPPVRPEPAGWTLAWVRSPSDPLFPSLDRLTLAHGFGAAWAIKMVQGGAEALVALPDAAADRAAAAAWITSSNFYVSELASTFHPGADGDYYFGDFVDPAFRGRGLQQLLINRRLARSQERGRAWAYCLTADDNHPSIRSYQAEGFSIWATLRRWALGRWELSHLKQNHVPGDAPRPLNLLTRRGRRMPFRLNLWHRPG